MQIVGFLMRRLFCWQFSVYSIIILQIILEISYFVTTEAYNYSRGYGLCKIIGVNTFCLVFTGAGLSLINIILDTFYPISVLLRQLFVQIFSLLTKEFIFIIIILISEV